MQLGEFIHVGVAYPVFPRRHFERENRKLPHVETTGNMVIVNLERERMENVLGIVQGNQLVFALARNLPGPHRAVDRIETIRFRGRAGRTRHRHVHAGKLTRQRLHAAHCLGVIRINTDEDIVTVVGQDLRGEFRHPVDDPAFLPSRNEHGNQLLGFVFQRLQRNGLTPVPLAQIAQELQIDEKVIEAEDEKTDRREIGQPEKDVV